MLFIPFHLRFRHLLPTLQDNKARDGIRGNGSKDSSQVSGRAVFVPEGGMESWDRPPFFRGAFAAQWCQREGPSGRGGQEADLTAKQQEGLCSEWGRAFLASGPSAVCAIPPAMQQEVRGTEDLDSVDPGRVPPPHGHDCLGVRVLTLRCLVARRC